MEYNIVNVTTCIHKNYICLTQMNRSFDPLRELQQDIQKVPSLTVAVS